MRLDRLGQGQRLLIRVELPIPVAQRLPAAVGRDVRRNFSRNRPPCQRGPMIRWEDCKCG